MPKVAVLTDFDDIKFQCQRCGSCCHHRRPAEFDDLVPAERLAEFVEKSNLIYLTPKDIHDIGHRARVKAADFVDTLYDYDGNCVKIEDGGRKVILDLPVMRSKEDTTCVFYRDGCTVYPVRPKACRLFPFRVEEKSTPEGDILLKISYNPSCPGIGKGEGVNTDGVVLAKEGRSGVVSAYVDKGGARALYVHPSVNDSLRYEEVKLEYARNTEFLHLASVDEKPFQAQKKLVAELSDIQVSLDPGEIFAAKGLTRLRPLLRRCRVVLPSEGELRTLTGKGWKEGAETLLKEGAEIVAVKLGERGCYVTDGKEKFQVEAFTVKAVDTTGAGDAFSAGFLYGLVKGYDLFQCGRLGNFVASRCITKFGARAGLPKLSDLVYFLK